jgi:serine/threonine protein kinase
MSTLGGRMGRHEILARLAHDDRAVVYAVRTMGSAQRDIRAMKALVGPAADADKLRTALTREALAQAEISHAQIAKVYEVVDAGDRIAFVSDFVRGESLKALLRAESQPFEIPLAVSIVSEIALIVSRAHSSVDDAHRPLLHGDLCPSNIMITYEGELVIREFAMALAESRLDRTRAGLRGRFGYMAPERARGEDVDVRTDIYSLGLILYEMLVGAPAFPHESDAALIDAALKPKIPKIAAKRRIGKGLERILTRMLEIDPRSRFTSMRELAMALSELRAHQLGNELKAELGRQAHRHFQHRERAMRTLMSRWSNDKPMSRSQSDPNAARPRSRSSVGARPVSKSSPSIEATQLFADLDLTIEAPDAAPIEITGSSRSRASSEIRLDTPIGSSTDDISAASSTGELLRPKRGLSFLRGIVLCLLLVILISASSWFWPPSARRATLYAANQIGAAISNFIDRSAATLSEHLPQ